MVPYQKSVDKSDKNNNYKQGKKKKQQTIRKSTARFAFRLRKQKQPTKKRDQAQHKTKPQICHPTQTEFSIVSQKHAKRNSVRNSVVAN